MNRRFSNPHNLPFETHLNDLIGRVRSLIRTEPDFEVMIAVFRLESYILGNDERIANRSSTTQVCLRHALSEISLWKSSVDAAAYTLRTRIVGPRSSQFNRSSRRRRRPYDLNKLAHLRRFPYPHETGTPTRPRKGKVAWPVHPSHCQEHSWCGLAGNLFTLRMGLSGTLVVGCLCMPVFLDSALRVASLRTPQRALHGRGYNINIYRE